MAHHFDRSVDAGLVIAGGMSRRMGRDKAALMLAGRSLLARTIDAIGAPVIVVGHPELAELIANCQRLEIGDSLPATFFDEPLAVALTREDPPLGGPAAGIVAGIKAMAALDDDAVIQLMPVDLPNASQLMTCLDGADWQLGDGLAPVDEDGRLQLPEGRYRLGALRAASQQLGDPHGSSVYRLLGQIERQEVTLPTSALQDVDDPGQAQAAGIQI